MKYLSFDIECCDGQHICEFGYTEGKGKRVKEANKEAAYKMLDYLGLIKQ